jgi:uncharacterized membrane protein YphA (DoxX/SURF4 family)
VKDGGIYVEILVRAPLDELWRRTQEPTLHERWDLRFSTIEYLPKESGSAPQRFRYATRIGFGARIEGEGESVATRDQPDGGRTSSLTFASSDPQSVIREGAGYWKYVPTPEGVRFLTWYDYRTRGGAAGALFDRVVFRPLLGWATAWSFDRLRLWLEHGIDPAASARQSVARSLARIAAAFVFAWHGLVPKLLGPHPDEVSMLTDAGVADAAARALVAAAGVLELALAACLLAAWRARWPCWVALAFLLGSLPMVAAASPRHVVAAFNPVTLNVSAAALLVVDLVLARGLPSASRCLRRPPGGAA